MTEPQRHRSGILGLFGLLQWLRRRHRQAVRRQTFDDLLTRGSDHLLDDIGIARPEVEPESRTTAGNRRPAFKPWMT